MWCPAEQKAKLVETAKTVLLEEMEIAIARLKNEEAGKKTGGEAHGNRSAD